MYAHTFIEQSFFIQLAQYPPYRFDVFVLVSDIRIVEIDPVTHLAGDIIPLILITENCLTALPVVLLYSDLFADIFLGDSQLFFYAQLDRETM